MDALSTPPPPTPLCRHGPPLHPPPPLQVAEHTTDKKKMNEPSMVLYNNLLSIPPILLLGAFFGEYGVSQPRPKAGGTRFRSQVAPALLLPLRSAASPAASPSAAAPAACLPCAGCPPLPSPAARPSADPLGPAGAEQPLVLAGGNPGGLHWLWWVPQPPPPCAPGA
jgi:hypothetical protein